MVVPLFFAMCLAQSQVRIELSKPDESLRPSFERYVADATGELDRLD
jgi:hypothetical protein